MISNTEKGRVDWDKVIIAMGELTTVILNPIDGPQILVPTPFYKLLGRWRSPQCQSVRRWRMRDRMTGTKMKRAADFVSWAFMICWTMYYGIAQGLHGYRMWRGYLLGIQPRLADLFRVLVALLSVTLLLIVAWRYYRDNVRDRQRQ